MYDKSWRKHIIFTVPDNSIVSKNGFSIIWLHVVSLEQSSTAMDIILFF